MCLAVLVVLSLILWVGVVSIRCRASSIGGGWVAATRHGTNP